MSWGGKDDITYQERPGGGVAKVMSFVSFKRINLICFPFCHLFQTLLFPTSCRTLQAHEELFSWMEITWNVGNKDPPAHIKKSSRTQSWWDTKYAVCATCTLKNQSQFVLRMSLYVHFAVEFHFMLCDINNCLILNIYLNTFKPCRFFGVKK